MATWEECNQPIEKIVPPKSVLEITENGKYDVLGKSGVDVNVSGGGSSDLSLANVTFINSAPDTVYYIRGMFYLSNGEFVNDEVEVYDNVTLSLVAYKTGYPYAMAGIQNADYSVMPSATGGAAIDMNKLVILVSGDGTFTAAGMPGQ